MAEEAKKSHLLLLTKTGGWADDDIDEENETQETTTKTKAWEPVEKPEVVPIGTDFDIGVSKESEQKKEKHERGFKDDSRRDFRGGRGSGFKDDSRGRFPGSRGGSRGGFQGSKFGGRQNGFDRKPFESESRWGSRSSLDDRKRKPLQLEPRSEGRSSVSPSTGVKESPFGEATPVEVKEKIRDTPTTSTVETKPSETTPKKTESPFGEATPVEPPVEKFTETTTTTRVETKESPSWRTRKDRPSDFKKKESDKRRFPSSKRGYDNGSPFSKPRKDKSGSGFVRKKDKGSDSWSEVRSGESRRSTSSQTQTTSNVKTEKNDSMVNKFAVLGDMEESE